MHASNCPSLKELTDFALGVTPETRLTAIANHIEACARCEQTLRTLDEQPDPVTRALRNMPATASFHCDAPPANWIAQACSAFARSQSEQFAKATLERLGKFELLEELGIGSFGYVFRARDTELDRIVAVKILRAGRLASRDDVDRFLREARSAAQLQHSGIVSLFETGQTEEGTYYLVEEFVSGKDLATYLDSHSVSLREAAKLIADIADALDYAHRHGVIHRDIKPSNIMLDQENRPHLMDFGLAKREADEAHMTVDGQVLGTPAYMSPEQARGQSHEVDARSDIYSLGVIFYELLTGERPFSGNRRMLLLQVLQDEPRPTRQLNEKIPRDLETICLKAMAKSPARRYATAKDLADDLGRYLKGEPIQARPVGQFERLWSWCRRNPMAVSLLVAITLGAAFGLGYLSWLSNQLVRSTALESAAQTAVVLEEVNAHYSDNLEKIKEQGFQITEDPRSKKDSHLLVEMEVPARFTINLGKRLRSRSASAIQIRLFSNYPFKSRKDGGPRDDFERTVLNGFTDNPDKPVYSFEDYQGRWVLRYAIARRMKASCIYCHNHHPDSIKRDWRVGDVRGVLEIIRPLDRDIARTHEGLRGTFVLVAAVFGSLLVVSILVLYLWNRSRR